MLFGATFSLGLSEYEFFLWGEPQPEGRLMEFADPTEAKLFLSRFHADRFGAGWMCAFDHLHAMAGRLDPFVHPHLNQTPLDRLADHLWSKRLQAVKREIKNAGVWSPQREIQAKQPASEPADPQAPADSFLVLKLVEDQSNLAATGVKLSIKFADGYGSEYPGGLTGRIDIRAIVAGKCEIRSNPKDAYIGDCYCFVTQGDSPSDQKDEPAYPGKTETTSQYKLTRASKIIEVEPYRVQDGDTLESIAGKNNLTAKQLAYFNYGVKDMDGLNRMLYYNLGCDTKTPDGQTFAFESDDNPGILYLPKPWAGLDLDSGQEHTLRLKQIRPVIRIDCEMDLDDPDTQNDEIWLETTDGCWRHVIQVKDLKEEHEENQVQLVFPKPPEGKRFNLVQDPKDGDEPFYLAKDLELDALLPFDFEEI